VEKEEGIDIGTLRSKVKIGIIDDSKFSRTNIAKMLADEGYTIAFDAGNAIEAMRALGTYEVNVLIIDVVMPDVNGIELTETLKENFTDVCFVIISSLKQDRIIIEALSAGAIDFLQKPIEKAALLSTMEKCMDQLNIEDQ